MVYKAFDALTVMRGCPSKIESSVLWNSCLIVGCYDGSLRIYVEESGDAKYANNHTEKSEANSSAGSRQWSNDPGSKFLFKPKETRIGFARKSILQMDVLPTKNLLVTLSDGVSVHALPDLDMITHFGKTRGANVYSWNNAKGILCAAVKRKLFFFKFIGTREFSEMKEVSIPDTVRSMAWSGDSLLLGLGSKKEYWLLDLPSGNLSEVSSCGRSAPPLVLALPGGELLLGKDNIGVFVDNQAKSTRPGEAISWSEAPLSITVSPPYVIGRLSRFIEVRSMRTGHSLVQTIALSNVMSLSGNSSSVLASSERDIHHIKPVPLGVQIVQLAAVARYEDALSLCAILPPEDAHIRVSKEDSIHIRYGYHLFGEGKYEEAMEHFAKSTLDLPSILSLFPSIQLPDAAKHFKGGGNSDSTNVTFSEEVSEGTDFWGGSGNFEEISSGFPDGDGEKFESLTEGDLVYALGALVSLLSSKRTLALQKAEAEQGEEDVLELLKKGGERERNRGGEEANHLRTVSRKSGDFSNHAAGEKPVVHEEDKDKGSHLARSYATVLDTSLLQALLALDSSPPIEDEEREVEGHYLSRTSISRGTDVALTAVKSSAFRNVYESTARFRDLPAAPTGFSVTDVFLLLLEGLNYCDVNTCEEKLREAGRLRELIALYKQRGLHTKALQLLQDLGKTDGPERTVEYLKALGAKEERLLLEYSEWILKEHPEHAVQLFTTLDPPLPTGIVLEHLKIHRPPLRAAYLEHLLGTVGDTGGPSGLHDELVQLHLDRMVDERRKFLAGGGQWDENHLSESRNKLLSILELSSAYSPVMMLSKLPQEAFHMERGLLLAKMRLHLPVFAVYIRKLHNLILCLDYCDRIFMASHEPSDSAPSSSPAEHATPGEAASIYVILLRVCLDPVHTIQEFNRTLSAVFPATKSPEETNPIKPKRQNTHFHFIKKQIEEPAKKWSPTSYSPKGFPSLSDEDDDEEQSNGHVVSTDIATASPQENNIQAVDLENEWGLDISVLIEDALSVLAKRWERLDPSSVFTLLPDWTTLKGLMQYLEPVLRRASENCRNASVVKALRRSENLQVRSELLSQRLRSVKITSDKSCAICRKRIGNSVFAVYPNDMAVHFVCHQDRGRRAGLVAEST